MKSKNVKNGKKLQSNYEFIKIIFFTKYNRHVLNDKISSRATQLISEVLLSQNCRIYKIHIKPNYVLLIIGKPVKLETPKLMGRVKSISSVQLRREFSQLVERTPKALWAVKYKVLD
jgi:REP element-mobilizing transposase RayT